jgi:hypothetical protein
MYVLPNAISEYVLPNAISEAYVPSNATSEVHVLSNAISEVYVLWNATAEVSCYQHPATLGDHHGGLEAPLEAEEAEEVHEGRVDKIHDGLGRLRARAALLVRAGRRPRRPSALRASFVMLATS